MLILPPNAVPHLLDRRWLISWVFHGEKDIPDLCSYSAYIPAGKADPKSVHESEKSEVAQLCSTVCDPVDCSPPGSSVHGILRQEY